MKPLAIDLFCGLGGWTEGLLAEGYYVVGFDNVQHVYGEHRYPAQLVIQDVLTLHGAQFRDAALIVASPPCQAYSWRAMPWKAAKAAPPPDNSLFEACFRIQRQASDAAGRRVPMVVENVFGAQKWVGRSRWNFGSYHLWGDVPALMPMTGRLLPKYILDDMKNGQRRSIPGIYEDGVKVGGISWSKRDANGKSGVAFNTEAGRKCGGSWFGKGNNQSLMRKYWSGSTARKAAQAAIAKIPMPLARHIARTYFQSSELPEHPNEEI